MSTPFTSIVGDTALFQVDLLNEIIDALSERRQVLGQGAATQVVAGDDIQDVNFWLGLQQWIETYCTSFVDHTATIDGAASIPFFTLASFRSAAGLPAGGFRRATAWDPDSDDWTNNADGMYSFGTMQTGTGARDDDIIGPWILVDLQRALSALKYTRITPTGTKQFMQRASYDADCATARAYVVDGWPGSWAADTAPGYLYLVQAQLDDNISPPALGYRSKALLSSSSIPTVVAASIDAYFYLTTQSGITFADVDGEGYSEDTWHLAESLGSAQSASRQMSSYFGDHATCPLTDAGLTCPYAAENSAGAICINASNTAFIMKWEFTTGN
jgi:hypothetical protein